MIRSSRGHAIIAGTLFVVSLAVLAASLMCSDPGVDAAQCGDTFENYDESGLNYTVITLVNGVDAVCVSGYTSNIPSEVHIPSTILLESVEYEVCSISNSAFLNAPISMVSIPSVKVIEEAAFMNCRNLTKVTDCFKLIDIKENAFFRTEISSLNLPVIEKISEKAFSGCTSLLTLQLSNTVTYIDTCIFESPNLVSITIPDGCKNYKVFEKALYCNKVNGISDQLMFIPKNSVEFRLPSDLGLIHENVFKNCKSLERIITIENPYFYTKDGILYSSNDFFHIPASIKGSISISDKITEISDNSFSNFIKIEKIYFPSSISKIGDGAFKGCTNLKEIYFESGLKSIGNNAFSGCNVNYLSFKSNVKMGNNTFELFDDKGATPILPSISTPNEYEIQNYKFKMVDGKLCRGSNITLVVHEKSTVVFVCHGEEYLLPKPTLDTFEFKNWYVLIGGLEQSIVSISAENTEDLIIYSLWGKDVTITFIEDGQSPIIKVYKAGCIIDAPPLHKSQTGYTPRWNTSSSGNGLVLDSHSRAFEDTTYYSVLTPNEIVIMFDTDGGVDIQPLHTHYDCTFAPDKFIPKKIGSTFLNWYWKNQKLSGTVLIKDLASSGTVILSAKWEVNTYIVRFLSEPGEEPIFEKTYEYNSPITMIPISKEKIGYMHDGWVCYGKYYPENSQAIKLVESGVVDIFINWVPNKYKITMVSGTSPQQMIVDEFSYGEDYNLKLCSFVKDGYTFKNWKLGNVLISNGGWIHKNSYAFDIKLTAQWVANEYDVIFMPNGGSGFMETQTLTYDHTDFLLACSYEKEGHSFAGWSKKLNGALSYADSENVSNIVCEGEVYLYALWTVNNYKIVFDTLSTDPIDDLSLPYGSEIKLPVPNKVGYKFAGWEPDVGKIMPAHDINLVAKWVPNTYEIQYHNQNGIIKVEKIEYDAEFAIIPCNQLKEGHSFKEWNSLNNGSGDSYLPNQLVKNLATSGTINLYAQWVVNKYSLIFQSNGDVLSSQSVEYGLKISIPDLIPRTGYSFEKWDSVVPDTMPAHDLTITAVWVPNEYEVRYHGPNSILEICKVKYDSKFNIATCKVQREGHTFLEWNSSINGDGLSFHPTQSVMNLTDCGIFDLYSKWTVNTYSLSFKSQNSVFYSCDVKYDETIVIPDSPILKGYSFKMWDPVVPATMPAKDLEFSAIWVPNVYEVHYFDQLGVIHVDKCVYDVEFNIAELNLEKEGHTFLKWTECSTGEGKSYVPQEVVKNLSDGNTVNLYALWAVNSYKVTFNNGPSILYSAGIEYGQKIIQPDIPKEIGHTFKGWDEPVPDSMPAHNLVFNAKWSVNCFNVTYHGPTGVLESTPVEYNSEYLISECNTQKRGHTFTNWNTSPDGSGTSYAPGTNAGTLSSVDKFTINLYAQWSVNKYLLTFKIDNKIVSSASVEFGSILQIPDCPLVEGYSFVSWGAVLPEKMPDENCTFTAILEPISYSVTYLNSDIELRTDILKYDQVSKAAKCTASKTGHSFIGWALNENETKVDYLPDEEIKNLTIINNNTVKLYALWAVNSYQLLFKNGDSILSSNSIEYGAIFDMPDLPVIRGYNFVSWDKEVPDCMPANDLTFNAIWSAKTYSVCYHDHTSEVYTNITHYDECVSIQKCQHIRDGYAFSGWNTSVDGSGLSYLPNQKVYNLIESGVIDLYAQWSVNEYTLSLCSEGSIIDSMTQDYDSEVPVPHNPVRTGYLFCGWDRSVPDTMPAENTELNALWRPIEYTVDVHPFVGSSVIKRMAAEYGTELEIPAPSYVPKGQRFLGWADTADGSPVYDIGDTVKDLCTVHGGSIELYPVTEYVIYTLTFADRDGNVLGSIEGRYMSPIDPGSLPRAADGSELEWDRPVPLSMPAADLVLTVSDGSAGGSPDSVLPVAAVIAAAVAAVAALVLIRHRVH